MRRVAAPARVDRPRMDAPVLDHAAARALHLAAQGLLRPWPRRARKGDVLAAIERMQLLQIDTIQVVARSPYLVLYSRLGPYDPAWLDGCLAEAGIFETWAHEACFAPMSSWPLLRQHTLDRRHHWAIQAAHRAQGKADPGMAAVLQRIREHGEMRSADFRDGDRPRGGWWGWKDEKRWLEAWFALGELMVARRDRFQRVYDLSERVLARAGMDPAAHAPLAPAELRRELVARTVLALGIAKPEWVADYYRLGGRVSAGELEDLVERGLLRRVSVQGVPGTAYVHVGNESLLQAAMGGRLRASLTTVLSPFDPVVWDRRRARELFGFDYRLECYVPAEKRRFGYFVLPLLHRGRLCGRMDAKAHRADGVFEIRRLALEEGVDADAPLCEAVAGALHRFARWHGCECISVARGALGPGLARPLRQAIRESTSR